jgi:ribosomal protein S12 methylthiotransferase
MGVFTYSCEPDTPAALLPDQVPEEIRHARRDRLMQVQQEIARTWHARQVGRQVEVLLDQPVPGEKNVWVGRSPADAPDVDGAVYVTGDRQRLRSGDLVPVEIVAAQDYDLIGVAAGRPRPRAIPPRQD